MAIRVSITNTSTGTVLAARDIPDAALADIREVFPGTAAQAAQALLNVILRAGRAYVAEQLRLATGDTAAIKAAAEAAEVAKATRLATLASNWPET